MNYEQAWKELEGVIKGNFFIYNSAFMGEEQSVMDRTIVNALDAVSSIMEDLKEKYEEGEA